MKTEIQKLRMRLALSQKLSKEKQSLIRKLKRRNEFLESYPYYSHKAYENKRKDELKNRKEKP